jgi:uncharacterized repeat protein (TIGR01451 family)
MSSLLRGDIRRPGSPRAARVGSPARRTLSRGWLFALFAVVCVVISVAYVAWSIVRPGSAERLAVSGPVATGADEPGVALVAGGPGTVLFQNTIAGEYAGRVSMVPLGGREWPRNMAPLGCMRVHYAADRGLCLAEDGGTFSLDGGIFSTHAAYVFGPDFQVLHALPLNGVPSRARVSPDGRYGATTSFVSGHSYSDGSFSTETMLIDLTSGAKLGNLEEFAVVRDGQRIEAEDFNFWGVTFASDSNRFYATLATGGQTYLVEGDVGARQLRVLRENVECPSLSPDGTRLAFKKRVGGDFGVAVWRFHVLDLATMKETPLAETRSIDDQIEWLDDDRVLYGDGWHLWSMPADGSGTPRRFMSNANSPAVVRTASLPASGPEQAPVKNLTLPSIDLAVAVSTGLEDIAVGEDLTYTVTVTNQGPVDATGLLVEQILPEGLNFGEVRTVSLTGGTSYGCSSQYPQETRVTCDTPVLPSGASWTIALTVKPGAAGTLKHQATVYATEPDANPENDTVKTKIVATAGE